MQLAEFNRGVMRHDWDDPRMQDFVGGLDLVNAVAARSDGFLWRLPDEDMEAAQLDPAGPLGGNPRLASTLSVWRDFAALRHFVLRTVHRRFMDRGEEWFAPGQGLRLVMWTVQDGHRPSVAEAAERFALLEAHGDTDRAFGWDHAMAVAAEGG